MCGRFGAAQTGDQKSNVANPQSATPASSIVQSEGFSANSLPSLTTYAIIADTRC
jgi:hypothetical protein